MYLEKTSLLNLYSGPLVLLFPASQSLLKRFAGKDFSSLLSLENQAIPKSFVLLVHSPLSQFNSAPSEGSPEIIGAFRFIGAAIFTVFALLFT